MPPPTRQGTTDRTRGHQHVDDRETPERCGGRVECTGLLLRARDGRRPAQAWQAFACREHADDLIARRRLLARDQALLAAWREEAARWETGHPHRPPPGAPARPPRPLAEGAAAFALIDRGRDSTTARPVDTGSHRLRRLDNGASP